MAAGPCRRCGGPHDTDFCEDEERARVEENRMVGTTVGPYRILQHLGSGSMGSVYRAAHEETAGHVALKVVNAQSATRFGVAKRFRREAEAIRRMSHPNVVSVLDVGEDKDLLYLAMEFCDGVTLEQSLGLTGKTSPLVAAHIAEQVASGLAEAHSLGFVHRDLKPGNLMLVGTGAEERVKILDFGLVGLYGDSGLSRLTAHGFTVGTPTYMAPEQYTDAQVGPEADVYALGAVIYEMVTGAPLFTGNLRELTLKHIVEVPKPLPHYGGLGPLVARMLDKQPDNRPKSGPDLVGALSRIRSLLDAPDSEGGREESNPDRTVLDRKLPSFGPESTSSQPPIALRLPSSDEARLAGAPPLLPSDEPPARGAPTVIVAPSTLGGGMTQSLPPVVSVDAQPTISIPADPPPPSGDLPVVETLVHREETPPMEGGGAFDDRRATVVLAPRPVNGNTPHPKFQDIEERTVPVRIPDRLPPPASIVEPVVHVRPLSALDRYGKALAITMIAVILVLLVLYLSRSG